MATFDGNTWVLDRDWLLSLGAHWTRGRCIKAEDSRDGTTKHLESDAVRSVAISSTFATLQPCPLLFSDTPASGR